MQDREWIWQQIPLCFLPFCMEAWQMSRATRPATLWEQELYSYFILLWHYFHTTNIKTAPQIALPPFAWVFSTGPLFQDKLSLASCQLAVYFGCYDSNCFFRIKLVFPKKVSPYPA